MSLAWSVTKSGDLAPAHRDSTPAGVSYAAPAQIAQTTVKTTYPDWDAPTPLGEHHAAEPGVYLMASMRSR
jgi:hypothetical protein